MSRRAAAAAALVAWPALLLAGCAVLRSGGGGQVVSAAVLQQDIADRLTAAGHPPKSVSCKEALAAEVGATTRCDVVLTDTNEIQPVITRTQVEPVSYSVSPAVSADQLAVAVGALLSGARATCRSGLEGKPGAQAQCDVTKDGVELVRTVEVTNVEGLLMSYRVLPVLGRRQVEDLLRDRLGESGTRPDSVQCAGDLQGKPGATLDCTTITAGQRQDLTLTVSGVTGDVIDFALAPKA